MVTQRYHKKQLTQMSISPEKSDAPIGCLWVRPETGRLQYFCFVNKINSLLHKHTARFYTFLYCCCFLLSSSARASFEDHAPAAHSLAMAGSGVASRDAHPFLNPASLVMPNSWQFITGYGRPFGLAELQQSDIVGVAVFDTWRAAAGALTFGYEAYRENTYVINVAIPLKDLIRAGATLRYADLAILRYGRAGALLIDFGMQAEISGAVAMGFCVKNAAGARIGRCREELPRSVQIGCAFQALRQVNLCMDLYKDIRFPLEWRSGGEWRPIALLALCCGIASSPVRLAAGFALHFHAFSFDYGMMTHEYLGLNHQFSVSFSLNRK